MSNVARSCVWPPRQPHAGVALHIVASPLWVCDGAFDALAWRHLARQAALDAAAYGGAKGASAAWGAGVLAIETGATDVAYGHEEITGAADGRETYEERLAIMMYDGHLPYAEAACVAWAVLPERTSAARET